VHSPVSLLTIGLWDVGNIHQERPLEVWKIAEKEACGRFSARLLGSLTFHLRRMRISYKIPLLSPLINSCLIDALIQLISTRMSYIMTLACEVRLQNPPCGL
jgi:hypothetical protein